MDTLQIHYKEFGSFDLVVVGGGCTGVCAAVRAARLGLKAAIVEKSGCFGGVATGGLPVQKLSGVDVRNALSI